MWGLTHTSILNLIKESEIILKMIDLYVVLMNKSMKIMYQNTALRFVNTFELHLG